MYPGGPKIRFKKEGYWGREWQLKITLSWSLEYSAGISALWSRENLVLASLAIYTFVITSFLWHTEWQAFWKTNLGIWLCLVIGNVPLGFQGRPWLSIKRKIKVMIISLQEHGPASGNHGSGPGKVHWIKLDNKLKKTGRTRRTCWAGYFSGNAITGTPMNLVELISYSSKKKKRADCALAEPIWTFGRAPAKWIPVNEYYPELHGMLQAGQVWDGQLLEKFHAALPMNEGAWDNLSGQLSQVQSAEPHMCCCGRKECPSWFKHRRDRIRDRPWCTKCSAC